MRGDGLVALAAALRLARLGHRVQIISADPRWRTASTRPLAAELPPVLELPSAWKDLFAKSGRNMEAELTGAGLQLVEAPAPVHCREGVSLTLPTERAAQIAAVRDCLGPPAATAWREILDRADDLWQARRRLGLERPVRAPLRVGELPDVLRGHRSLTDGAAELPPLLAAVLSSTGPRDGGTRAGAGAWLLASDLAVSRVFGRWQLLGDDGPSDLQPLLALLDDRLVRRGVEVLAEPGQRPDVLLDTEPAQPGRRTIARLRARPTFWAPAVCRTTTRRGSVEPCPGAAPEGIAERVDHTPDGPRIVWQWRRGDRLVTLGHDHTRPVADPDRGPAVPDLRQWARRPPLAWTERDGIAVLSAGAASHGGPEPWAQLLTGALAAYRVHLRLTGEDVSPTNRAVGADGRIRSARRRP